MDATTISQLLNIESNAQTIRFLQVVPTTFMVYDCILYLDDEINYIWKRMSSMSVVYLIFRYLGIVYVVFSLAEFATNTNSFTKFFSNDFPILAMWLNCLSVWFVQAILGLRLYALYNGSKRVLLVMGLGFVAECVIMIVCISLLSVSSGQGLLILGSKISALPAAARKIYVNYGAIGIYEIILFSLALSAAVRRYREKFAPRPANWSSGAKRLRDILIEGNVVYFLANMIYAIFYFVVSLTLPSEWLFGVLSLGFAMTSTIGCRLILHIRSAAAHPSTSPDYTDDEARPALQ